MRHWQGRSDWIILKASTASNYGILSHRSIKLKNECTIPKVGGVSFELISTQVGSRSRATIQGPMALILIEPVKRE
jgi:hypothetical protein